MPDPMMPPPTTPILLTMLLLAMLRLGRFPRWRSWSCRSVHALPRGPGFRVVPAGQERRPPSPARTTMLLGQLGYPAAPRGEPAGGRRMISGKTTLIAHLGYPTFAFKAPLIYNPWFEKNDIDAVVVPMGVKAEEYPEFFRYLFKLTNIRGALVTMPHKVTTTELVDELTPTARVAGAANAVLLREDGTLVGDQF